jgi:hypothetical protein
MSWTSFLWPPQTPITGLMKKETGANGACQFSSVAECLSTHKRISSSEVRTAAAQGILAMGDDQFSACLLAYQLETSFIGGWNPHEVRTKQGLAEQLLLANLPGNESYFWGDDVTLSALAFQLELDIYVLEHMTSPSVVLKARPLCQPFEKPRKAILLWYNRPGLHYQSIGLFRNSYVQTLLHPHEVPFFLREAVRDKTKSRVTIPLQEFAQRQSKPHSLKALKSRRKETKKGSLVSLPFSMCHYVFPVFPLQTS